VLVGLTAWVLAPAGIIELGKKGQKAKGSWTTVYVENHLGSCFYVESHFPNEPASTILLRLKDCINGAPATCTVTGPAECNSLVTGWFVARIEFPNRLSVDWRNGGPPLKLGIYENDEDFTAAAAEMELRGGKPIDWFSFPEVTSANYDGTIDLVATLVNRTDITATVDTNSAGNLVQLNDDIETELIAKFETDPNVKGFDVVRDPDAKTFTVVSNQGPRIRRVYLSHTDTGIAISDLTVELVGGGNIPTLSQWGLLVLVLLLVTSAILALRRRRLRSTS
jgi:hypothetical protein